ncbi:MAG TPA: peptide chain release factor N(5)-glutamine methyltransferase [Gaiellaceae bacterium]|nr:peptide chain release factor N(5)-glutamine methyltransferase [Gaiellaceae bacterium]
MTVREALAEGTAALEAAGCPSPAVDAEWLLADVLGTRRSELHVLDRDLDEEQAEHYRALVSRRAAREPLAYILGEWGFRRLTLSVDPRVLIPRPETETVVERSLALLEGVEDPRVLDVGVGSGAIALALADERPDVSVVATDVSTDALEVAEANRLRAGLNGRVRFVHGDLLAGESGPFDLVVSNPPYVGADELEALEPELLYEPRGALVGVEGHEQVARAVLPALARGGAIVLEVADRQAPEVAALLQRLGFAEVRVSEDLAGRERVVEGRRR